MRISKNLSALLFPPSPPSPPWPLPLSTHSSAISRSVSNADTMSGLRFSVKARNTPSIKDTGMKRSEVLLPLCTSAHITRSSASTTMSRLPLPAITSTGVKTSPRAIHLLTLDAKLRALDLFAPNLLVLVGRLGKPMSTAHLLHARRAVA